MSPLYGDLTRSAIVSNHVDWGQGSKASDVGIRHSPRPPERVAAGQATIDCDEVRLVACGSLPHLEDPAAARAATPALVARRSSNHPRARAIPAAIANSAAASAMIALLGGSAEIA
jgi:hypothetical protein